MEAQADAVHATLRLTQPLQVRNNQVSRIVPGTMFVRLGELVHVASIDGNNVEVIDDNGLRSSIDVNEATQLLDDYIG